MARFGSRKFQIGLISMGLFLLAIASTASVGAAAPPYVNAYTAHGCVVGDDLCLARSQVYPGAFGYYGYGALYLEFGYAYKDNRYCGDGNVIATPNGYFCANGSPLYLSNSPAPAVNPVVVYTGAPVPVTFAQPGTAANRIGSPERK